MTIFLKIDIWKKGTNKYTTAPDYQIEVSESELHKVTEGIDALREIARALQKNKEEGERDNANE